MYPFPTLLKDGSELLLFIINDKISLKVIWANVLFQKYFPNC